MSNAGAQARSESAPLEGYYGSVEILPNAARKEITIALKLSYATEGKSNQIVFHVQEENAAVPPFWSGSARILAGDGVLMVIPKDESTGWLFEFSERQRSDSLDKISLIEYPAIGIGRYGEKAPLTAEQIHHLAANGRL